MLCWHRPVIRKNRFLCERCDMEIVECPCVSYHRAPDDDCDLCMGSGWLAVVRSNKEKFEEYLARDRSELVLVSDDDDW